MPLYNILLACPEGTYNEGLFPGDKLACISCPDAHHITIKNPATRKDHCVCKENMASDGDKCKSKFNNTRVNYKRRT